MAPMKLIFRQDDMRLLGVHVVGEQATELVHLGLYDRGPQPVTETKSN